MVGEKSWFVYLLECSDGTYYTGITTDIDKRIKMHKEGKGSKYVFSRGFKKIICSKKFLDRSQASKAEYLVKNLPRLEKISWFKN